MSKEIDIQTVQLDRMETVSRYAAENCNPDGTIKDSVVLSPEEEAGRQEILDGIKSKDWILYTSDKSGKMVLDTR